MQYLWIIHLRYVLLIARLFYFELAVLYFFRLKLSSQGLASPFVIYYFPAVLDWAYLEAANSMLVIAIITRDYIKNRRVNIHPTEYFFAEWGYSPPIKYYDSIKGR